MFILFVNKKWVINPFFPLLTMGRRRDLSVFQLDRFQKLLPLLIISDLINLALGILRVYDQATWPYTPIATLTFLLSTYCRLSLVRVEKINTTDIQSIRPAPLLIWIEHFIYFFGITVNGYGIGSSENGAIQSASLILCIFTLILALCPIVNFLFAGLCKRAIRP